MLKSPLKVIFYPTHVPHIMSPNFDFDVYIHYSFDKNIIL